MDSIEQRMTRLEGENRRLRIAVLLAILVPAAFLLMGQARYPKRIETEALVVRAPDGAVVAYISGDENAGPTYGDGSLTLYRADGSLSLTVWPESENNRNVRLSVVGPRDANGAMRELWAGPPR